MPLKMTRGIISRAEMKDRDVPIITNKGNRFPRIESSRGANTATNKGEKKQKAGSKDAANLLSPFRDN